MKELLFATNNLHKVREVREILGEGYRLISLTDAGISEELPETGKTLEENAIQKATAILKGHGLDCFSEDTGLEVDALGGAPGVHTARYAGPEADAQANISRLLAALEGLEERNARFRTVIALWLQGQLYTFHGVVEGKISKVPFGEGGFGYDPVFIPKGHEQTFAELDPKIKSTISHRAKAIQELVGFLTDKHHQETAQSGM